MLSHEPDAPGTASQREETSEFTRHRSDRKAKHEWDAIRAPFEQFYVVEDLSLKESLNRLRSNHGFNATPNQMKFMIKKWGIEKKVKSSEMRHIIEIQKWRQEQNPLKQTRFVVRGRPVTEAKIERYKKTHTIESNLLTDEAPSTVLWDSPRLASIPSDFDSMRYMHPWNPTSNLGNRPMVSGPQLMTPSMGAFNWWSYYGASYSRQSAPTPYEIPLWRILGRFIIKGDTFEEEMYNRNAAAAFQITKTEIISQNLIDYGGSLQGSTPCANDCSKHYRILFRQKNVPIVQLMRIADTACSICRIDEMMRLYVTWESAHEGGSQGLSYAPNRTWCVSEILKLAMLTSKSRPAVLITAMPFCVSEVLQNDPDFLCAAIVDYCKQDVDTGDVKLTLAVLLSFFLLLAGFISHSARLMEAIIRDNAPDLMKPPSSPYYDLPTTTYPGGLSVVIRRYLAAAHNSALWWLYHPVAWDRVINSLPKRLGASTCFGSILNDYHFCFRGCCQTDLSRHTHPKILAAEEDLFSLELTYAGGEIDIIKDGWKVQTQTMWLLQLRYGCLLEQDYDETRWEPTTTSVAGPTSKSTKTLDELLI